MPKHETQLIRVRDAARVIDAMNAATEFDGAPEDRVDFLLRGLLQLLDRSALCALIVCEDLQRKPAPVVAKRFLHAPTPDQKPIVPDENVQSAAEHDMHPLLQLIIPKILARIRSPFTFIASEVLARQTWFEERIRPVMDERGYVDALISAWAASADRALVVALMRREDEPAFVEEDVNFLSLLVRACAPFVDREIFVSSLPTTGKELTGRQREVLGHLLYGSCEKEIAGYLSRSVHTVHTYIKQIYSAFGVNSRGELMALFIDDAVREAIAQSA
jgi:DNA-binding CsgD family transcriptional regulator